MYRRATILARNISIELPMRRSSSEIAGANRDPSRVTAIGLNCRIGIAVARFLVSAFDEGPLRQRFPPVIARNYSAELVAHALARGH